MNDYTMTDMHLRNTLDDDNYSYFSSALHRIASVQTRATGKHRADSPPSPKQQENLMEIEIYEDPKHASVDAARAQQKEGL